MNRRDFIALGSVSSLCLASGCNKISNFGLSTGKFEIENKSISSGFSGTFQAALTRFVTPNHPPQIKITYLNTSSRTVYITFNEPAPFSTVKGTKTNGEAALQLESPKVTNSTTNGCWVGKPIRRLPSQETFQFKPGESIEIVQDLLNCPTNEKCYPSGRYYFEDSYSIKSEDETDDVKPNRLKWGFYVLIGN